MLYEKLNEIYRSGKPLKFMEQKTWEAINELVEENKRLKQEVEKWRKEAKYNYELYEENLEPDELAGFGTHGRW